MEAHPLTYCNLDPAIAKEMDVREFKTPGRMIRGGELYPDDAWLLIENFRRWIGHEELNRARKAYQAAVAASDTIAIAMMRERQPLVDAFELYEKVTFGRRRSPARLPPHLFDLANLAAHFGVVGPTLSLAIEEHHRQSLLGPGYRSTSLEWMVASYLAQSMGAQLAWFAPNIRAPELVALAQGLEFDVEVKHISHMITELFGDAEASAIAQVIFRSIAAHGLYGEVHIEVSEQFKDLTASQREAEVERLLAQLTPGFVKLSSDGLILLESSLKPVVGYAIDVKDWQRAVNVARSNDVRVYLHSVARGAFAVDPMTLYIRGPRRDSSSLTPHLWEWKFKKAAEQCTGTRGAFLIMEWEGISDPELFHSEGMQALIARTFVDYPHVAVIELRCDTKPRTAPGSVNYSTMAYRTKSSVTVYPNLAAAIPSFN